MTTQAGRPRVGSWGPPPRPLVAVSGVVVAVAAVLAVLGATRTGISTDEPIHVMRLRNYFDAGWYALDWDFTGPGPGSDGTNTYVYGPVAMLLLHAWSIVWGVDGWQDVSTSAHAYRVRHLGVVVIGLVGVAAAAAVGRLLLRYWRWGLVAAAVLVAVPMWTGHMMFNVKDVPVATGHTLCTLGLLLFVRDAPASGRLRVARAATLVSGLVLTLGTRPGMWSGLTVLLAVATVGVLWAPMGRRPRLTALAEVAVASGVAAAALVLIYPNVFGSPLRALPRTSETSSNFMSGQASDRLYVPQHLWEETPTLLLGFAVAGALVALVALFRHDGPQWVRTVRLALVTVQAFAVPAAAVVVGSDLYHGLRQLLFIVPALAVLAACGMAWAIERSSRLTKRSLVPVLGVAALVLPVADQVMMQPYQTSYVNLATDLLARHQADDDRPGDDFWRVSIPELVRDAQLDRLFLCKAATDEVTMVAYPFMNGSGVSSTSRNVDCREETYGPLVPAGLAVVRSGTATEFDAVFINALPPNCTRLSEVTRWRHGFEVVVATLARCSIDPWPLTAAGVRTVDPVLGTGLPGDLWMYATGGWLQWPGSPELTAPASQAGITFRVPPFCRRQGCSLVLEGAAPRDVVATVDGLPVHVERQGDGTVRVPVSARRPADAVWVTLSRGSGETLGMRLTGLRLERSPGPGSVKGLA
jgi:hypothetical protein